MLKKFVTLIMVICMLTVPCFSPLGIYAAGSTCILKSGEEITGGTTMLNTWDMNTIGTSGYSDTEGIVTWYTGGSGCTTKYENGKLICSATSAMSSGKQFNIGLGIGALSNSEWVIPRNTPGFDNGIYTVEIPIKGTCKPDSQFGGGIGFSVNINAGASNLIANLVSGSNTIYVGGTAVNSTGPWVQTRNDTVVHMVFDNTGATSKVTFYWYADGVDNPCGNPVDLGLKATGIQRFEVNVYKQTDTLTLEIGNVNFWEGGLSDKPVSAGAEWLCEDNRICLKGEKNTAYNVRLLNPKNGFNESYSISEYNAADSNGQASMVALDTALTTNSDGIAYLDHDFSIAGKYFAYLSSYAADVKAQSYFYIGGEKLLDNLSVNIDTPLFKEFVMSSLGVDSDASQKIINDYKALTDKGFVDSAASGGYMDFYAAVLFGNMFEQTAYNENLADELKSALTSLGLPTAGFDVLLMNNDYSDVMKELSEEASTVNSAADMLFDISVLKGVKNAIIPSEAESFLALIGNSKFDNALPEQKSIIASALKGNEYNTISELSDAVDGVNITPTVSEDNNDVLGNTNTGGSKIDFGGGSSSSGPSSPKPSTPTITPTPDDTPTNPEPVTPPEKAEPVEYNDVPDTHWAYESIAKMSEMGIISGYDGNFNPDNDVTRAEYLKMLCKIFGISESREAVFGDVSSNDWYAPFVYGAAKEGLVSGDGTNFRPNDSISREDAAVMLYRFMNYKGINFEKTNEITFADSSEFSIYAVEAIENLAAAGIINGKGDGIFAALDSMTRAEAAKLLLGAISE